MSIIYTISILAASPKILGKTSSPLKRRTAAENNVRKILKMTNVNGEKVTAESMTRAIQANNVAAYEEEKTVDAAATCKDPNMDESHSAESEALLLFGAEGTKVQYSLSK
jgi:hypothetical protein